MEGSDAPPAGLVVVPHSPWHSPVPYLFGGLAAMLGLIAFALLILACSYWKLSGYLDGGVGRQEDSREVEDIEAAAGERDLGREPKLKEEEFEEKILVIMAGEVKPTFLATPVLSRASSFGDNHIHHHGSAPRKSSDNHKMQEVIKEGHNSLHEHEHSSSS